MSFFRTIEFSDPRFMPEGFHHITVKSQALKMRADISCYVPYDTPAMEHLPLVILLHGVFGSHWAWAMKGGAFHTTASLIETKEISPMIIATPSDGLWGDGSAYLPHHEKDFSRWIVEEVPTAVNELVKSMGYGIQKVFIGGLSMGGFGAMYLGSMYPSIFSGISAHSSLTNTQHMHGFVEEEWTDQQLHFHLGDIIIRQKDSLPPLRFDCGKEDELFKANQSLHMQLKDAGIPHTYEELEGGHSWSYWEEYLPKSLLFFEQILQEKVV